MVAGAWTMRKAEQQKKDFTESEIMRGFQQYLLDTAGMQIHIKGVKHGELLELDLPYIHRWTQEYKNKLLAKFYKLDDWFKDSGFTDATFFTFTTRQQDFKNKADQYTFLKDNFREVRNNMREFKGKFSYIWVAEPHKSGYAHIHMLAFTLFTPDECERVKHLWCDVYKAGVREALDIQLIKASSDFGKHDKSDSNKLQSPKNYILKYLKKTFTEETDLSYFMFSAVAWHMGRHPDYKRFRFYGTSRDLSSVMKLDKDDDFTAIEVTMSLPSGDDVVLYDARPEARITYNEERMKPIYIDTSNIESWSS